MTVAVIGAGFAGLATAKVLRQSGFEVTVFDKAPDVGGVWSSTRRYPGLRTQNNKGSYRLSDHPMPRSFPEWPSGEQVQAYLEGYVRRFGLQECLRLGTEVIGARLLADESGWEVTTSDSDGALVTGTYEQLVVANGIFSVPAPPTLPGAAEFRAAGGRIVATSDLHEVEEARGRHVVVLGYGKSACDVAVPVSDVATSTTVVARELLWKMPARIKGVLNYKYLMLTRLGEALFRWIEPTGVEAFLHGRGNGLRQRMLGSIEEVTTAQLGLQELGLVPHGSFEDIARSTVSLATDGFFERVGAGAIRVHRDRVVERLLEKDGRPHAELSDGTLLPADLLVCGTGFRQEVPFLDPAIQRRITDQDGNFQLWRQIQPLTVPRLFFAGYNSSFFSPLSAEMAAIWIASLLLGGHEIPPLEQRRAHVERRLAWMQERTRGHHARGTNVIPFSMHNIDEVLDDTGLNVGRTTRALQWLLPLNPAAYRSVTRRLVRRRSA